MRAHARPQVHQKFACARAREKYDFWRDFALNFYGYFAAFYVFYIICGIFEKHSIYILI